MDLSDDAIDPLERALLLIERLDYLNRDAVSECAILRATVEGLQLRLADSLASLADLRRAMALMERFLDALPTRPCQVCTQPMLPRTRGHVICDDCKADRVSRFVDRGVRLEAAS